MNITGNFVLPRLHDYTSGNVVDNLAGWFKGSFYTGVGETGYSFKVYGNFSYGSPFSWQNVYFDASKAWTGVIFINYL